jgi:hypothetical protein
MRDIINLQIIGGKKYKKIIEIAALYSGYGIGGFVRNCIDHAIINQHGIDISEVEYKKQRTKKPIYKSAKEIIMEVIKENDEKTV